MKNAILITILIILAGCNGYESETVAVEDLTPAQCVVELLKCESPEYDTEDTFSAPVVDTEKAALVKTNADLQSVIRGLLASRKADLQTINDFNADALACETELDELKQNQ